MTVLEQAYKALNARALTRSQYEFSVRWCGKSKSYMSWAKSANAEPSADALLRIIFAIDDKLNEISGEEEAMFPDLAADDVKALSALRADLMLYLRRPSVPLGG